MIDYGTFAAGLSLVVVVLYLVLAAITVRRAQIAGRQRSLSALRDIRQHALIVEGPLVTVGLIAAAITLLSAVHIGADDYTELARLTVASIRGVLLVGGLYLFAFYWTVRDTWL